MQTHQTTANERGTEHKETEDAARRIETRHATVWTMPWPVRADDVAVYVHSPRRHDPGEHDSGTADAETVERLEEMSYDAETVDIIDSPAWPHAPRDERDGVAEDERRRQVAARPEAGSA